MECRLRFALGVSRPALSYDFVGELIIHRQIEMFAGVAASSMPTVRQYFASQNFVLPSWTSSLRSSLTHLLRSSAREKLPDHNSSVTEWGRKNLHPSEDHEKFRMKSLNPDGSERKQAKPNRAGDSQIRLTHEISITQADVPAASSRPKFDADIRRSSSLVE